MSFKDDLESLGYIMIAMISGNLPWKDLVSKYYLKNNYYFIDKYFIWMFHNQIIRYINCERRYK